MLNDRCYWNFQVGKEGASLRVRNVSLTIPQGAIDKEITITLAISENAFDIPKSSGSRVFVGPVVHCLPHGLYFKRLVKLAFDYSPEEVQEPSKMLVLYRYVFLHAYLSYRSDELNLNYEYRCLCL